MPSRNCCCLTLSHSTFTYCNVLNCKESTSIWLPYKLLQGNTNGISLGTNSISHSAQVQPRLVISGKKTWCHLGKEYGITRGRGYSPTWNILSEDGVPSPMGEGLLSLGEYQRALPTLCEALLWCGPFTELTGSPTTAFPTSTVFKQHQGMHDS
jgi:hypothetical protein